MTSRITFLFYLQLLRIFYFIIDYVVIVSYNKVLYLCLYPQLHLSASGYVSQFRGLRIKFQQLVDIVMYRSLHRWNYA